MMMMSVGTDELSIEASRNSDISSGVTTTRQIQLDHKLSTMRRSTCTMLSRLRMNRCIRDAAAMTALAFHQFLRVVRQAATPQSPVPQHASRNTAACHTTHRRTYQSNLTVK